jgi:hypothetical protein
VTDRDTIKLITGIAWLFSFFGWNRIAKGRRQLDDGKLVEESPLSTIAAIKAGAVEVSGKAVGEPLLRSPLQGIPCVSGLLFRTNVVAGVRFALVIRRRNSTLCYAALAYETSFRELSLAKFTDCLKYQSSVYSLYWFAFRSCGQYSSSYG